MKYLVAYDSFFGSTQKIAEAIGEVLGADTVNIEKLSIKDLSSVDFLVLGSPIRGWQPSENTQSFLSNLSAESLTGIKSTTFDTRVKLFIHGDAKDKMAQALKKAGAEISVPPEAFYVKGQEGPLLNNEVGRAKIWAEKIKEMGEK